MKKRIKEFGKESMILTGTGIGLGVGSSIMGDMGADATPLGKIGDGVGMAAGLSSLKLTTGILTDIGKDLKKKK